MSDDSPSAAALMERLNEAFARMHFARGLIDATSRREAEALVDQQGREAAMRKGLGDIEAARREMAAEVCRLAARDIWNALEGVDIEAFCRGVQTPASQKVH